MKKRLEMFPTKERRIEFGIGLVIVILGLIFPIAAIFRSLSNPYRNCRTSECIGLAFQYMDPSVTLGFAGLGLACIGLFPLTGTFTQR